MVMENNTTNIKKSKQENKSKRCLDEVLISAKGK